MNRPTDSVRVVIFDEDNRSRFMILTESDDPDNWKLQGGKFNDENEPPSEAAERELLEELLLEEGVASIKHAGSLTNNDGVSARHIFAVATHESQLQPTKEIAQCKWFPRTACQKGPTGAIF